MVLNKTQKEKLRSLEDRVFELKLEKNKICKELDEEIRIAAGNLRAEYQNRIYNKTKKVMKAKEKLDNFYSSLRKGYKHPERKDSFRNYNDAAKVLVYYWVGEDIPIERLVKGIAGGSESRLFYSRAFEYAQRLTKQGSKEREYVIKAQEYLWKDVGR